MVKRVAASSLDRLPSRPKDGHKGTFGTVTVVGGCCAGNVRYVGAPALAALGALRSGCGLCRVLAPEPVINGVLRVASSATGVALPVGREGGIIAAAAVKAVGEAGDSSHAVVAGPGLGRGAGVDAVVRRLWLGERADAPLVLDADGLNSLAATRKIERAKRWAVVTPHPGEAARLMKATRVEGDPAAERDRARIALELSHRLGAVVVLKGAHTVVSDGVHVYRNASGGPWLATGGTGDVLAGLIGGLIAQHMAGGGDAGGLFRIVCLGVLAHGRAGDAWAKEKQATGGMLAGELAERIPAEIERLRR